MARLLVFDTQAVNDTANNWGPQSSDPAFAGDASGVAADGSNTTPLTPWLDYSAGLPAVGSSINANWPGAESYPVRLFSIEGRVKEIAWEFVLTGVAGSINVSWYQEFYNDMPTPQVSPLTLRTVSVLQKVSGPFTDALGIHYRTSPRIMNLPLYCPWPREQVEVVGASGVITHYPITRSVALNSALIPPTPTRDLGQWQGASAWFPMVVNASWVRLRVYSTTSLGLPASYNINCPKYPASRRLRIFANVGGYNQEETAESVKYQDKLWYTFEGQPIVWAPWSGAGHGTFTGDW